jgi:hypothetical protein
VRDSTGVLQEKPSKNGSILELKEG